MGDICRHSVKALFALWVCVGTGPASAVDLLDSARNIFFNPQSKTRFGIEAEFTGIAPEKAAEVLRKRLGGTISVKNAGTEDQYLVIAGTRIGTVIVKPEKNETSEVSVPIHERLFEVVTEPLRLPELETLQWTMKGLREAGGRGTSPEVAVSVQVNLEVGEGMREKVEVQNIVNLLRSYVRPEHREQIASHLKVPEKRKPFLQPFSEGFTDRLLDPNYQPTERELYDDYIYRQSLERLGEGKAWTMPISEAKQKLLEKENPVVPEVVKLNLLRISSLLMFLFPEDPMSKLYQEKGWAVPRPIVEFREFNNELDVTAPVKEAMGLMEAAKKYGYYDHDSLVYALSGIDPASLASLRERVRTTHKEDPLIFRYFLGDPETANKGKLSWQLGLFGANPSGFLPWNERGLTPLVLPGESVVFHRRPIHGSNILGKYNPSLINSVLQQALENKLVEANFWEEYAPGAMPATETFSHFTSPETSPLAAETLAAKLRDRFPKGWVLKGVWDFGSEKAVITNDLDLAAELRKYRAGDFDEFSRQVREEHKDKGPEETLEILQKHEGYSGWRISQYLADPDGAIVQERLDIGKEFRVEVIAGKVLSNGSTIDRWSYLAGPGISRPPTTDQLRKVEAFAQSIIHKLPEELRGTPFGMDVALLRDGSVRLIESNPGGNSNFIAEENKESVAALDAFLKTVPKLTKQGQIHTGLSDLAQIRYLRLKFAKWGIDSSRHYRNMRFLADRIDDPEMPIRKPASDKYSVASRSLCTLVLRASRY